MPTVEPNRAALILATLSHLDPLIAGSRHHEDVAQSQTDRMKGNLPAVRGPEGSEVVARIGSELLCVSALHRDGAQAIAVCYLFSFVNPAHEQRTREICREIAPEISVSLSSDVDPTFREYERFCITAFDAYLGPVVKR